MKKSLTVIISAAAVAMIIASCGARNEKKETTKNIAHESVIEEENLITLVDSTKLNGLVVYNSNAEKKLPVVLIIHEWWGLNDYVKKRAHQLASMGYMAVAMDMYGDGKTAGNPEEAQNLATPFYTNPQTAYHRVAATLRDVKNMEKADTTQIVAIGYCFGGSMVLNTAKLGYPFTGAVSFHGGLAGVKPEKGKTTASILVCHGAADKFISDKEVADFRAEMDSTGVSYTFKEYANATHAFTNPDATANGKKFNIPIEYNEKADKESWKDFEDFLAKTVKK